MQILPKPGAAGPEAAVSIHRYVHAGQTLTLGRDHRDYRAFDKETVRISLGGFDRAPRQKPAKADWREGRGSSHLEPET